MRPRAVINRATLFAVVAIYSSLTCWNVKDQCDAAEPASRADLTVVEKDATVFSFKVHYREAGDGPVVILLHGLGGDGSRWTSIMAALASEFRVIAPDQIGFGQSDKPLVNYSHGMLEEFLVEFMKAIDVPKASLLGHSMGAYVSIYAAVHHPHVVDRLILVDGGGLEYKPRPSHIIQIQNGTTLAETREYFELMFYDKKFITDQMVRDNLIRRFHAGYTIGKMQEARAKGIGLVTRDQAAGITAPTLILWGKHDRLLDASDAETLNRVIPGSRAVLIEEAGHIPQVEKPERFNRLVWEFLTADKAAGRNSRGN